MATTKAGPIHADRLKSFIERIEKLEEERKAIGGDIKDVYSEAKGVGYDVKTMRQIVKERSQDAADRAEMETLLDVYRHALGMPGATYRSVAADHGVSKSKLHRLVPRERDGTRPEDGDDGISQDDAERGESDDEKQAVNGGTGSGGGNPRHSEGQDQGAGGRGRVLRQPDAGDDRADAEGAGGLRARQDDAREDGGGIRGIGAAQDQLSESPATPSVGAVGLGPTERLIAKYTAQTEEEALAAMEEAGARLRQMRAERGL